MSKFQVHIAQFVFSVWATDRQFHPFLLSLDNNQLHFSISITKVRMTHWLPQCFSLCWRNGRFLFPSAVGRGIWRASRLLARRSRRKCACHDKPVHLSTETCRLAWSLGHTLISLGQGMCRIKVKVFRNGHSCGVLSEDSCLPCSRPKSVISVG